MPFTFSHTAVIIPFLYLPRKWISVTGIVIGSMTPDFEYFLRMRIKSDYSHTLGGMLWFDLPLCLIVAFIFHNLIRNSLINHLPLFLKERFLPFKAFSWNLYFKKNIAVILISSMIGITSHCLWDAFTHPGGYFVEVFPILQSKVTISGYTFGLYKIVQYISGLIGVMLIVGLVMSLPRYTYMLEKTSNHLYWLLFFIFLVVITAIRFIVNPYILGIGNLIVTLIAVGFISFVIVGKIFATNKIS